MFGKRSDGKKIKHIDPYQKIIPHIMSARHDSQNFFKIPVRCAPLDGFIRARRDEEGLSFNYMHIVFAAMVRLLANRPQLNRFVMNGRIFRRNNVQISFAVKRTLRDEGQSTTIKLTFDGTEDIYTVKKKMDEAILVNTKRDCVNETDKTAKMLTNMPNCFIKLGVGFVKWLDKHGMLPKKIISASPFHTSCFITNMKSIKTDYIYHHIYDFGTTGIFLAMGKESPCPVADDKGKVSVENMMHIGVVTDERFCDGLYYANSLRLLQTYFQNPDILRDRLEAIVSDAE